MRHDPSPPHHAAGHDVRVRASALGFALAAIVLGACGDDEDRSTEDASADVRLGGDNLCGSFTGHGLPCSPVSTHVCFAECATGGCSCSAGPDGRGIWTCVTDLSCYPEGGIFDDAGRREAGTRDAADAAEGG